MNEQFVKVISAGCAAPLCIFVLVPMAVLAVSIFELKIPPLAEAVALCGFILVFVYPLIFLVGVPLYLLLHRVGWDNLWTAAGTGFLTPYVTQFVMTYENARDLAATGAPHDVAYRNLHFFIAHPLAAVSWLEALGVAIAVAFWAIAKFATVPIDASKPPVQK